MSSSLPYAAISPAGVTPAAPASTSSITSSSADGLIVNLSFGSISTEFGPVARVSGGPQPVYDETKSVGLLDKSLRLDPGSAVNPTLQIHATAIATKAASDGVAVDFVSAHGEATIGSSDFLLTSNPLVARGILSVLGLSLSATDVHSRADFSHVFGTNRSFVTGDASFGSLSIGGSLIGRTLAFTGDAAPNTVLFSSPTVTVTLDKQELTADLLLSVPGCANTPVGITTDAIDILSLHNATLFGKTVSGDLVIGESSAGNSPLFTPMHSAVF